ncbi:MAG: hypothetical protein PHF31_16585 [Methylobacter sp.]|nr:hypothetical protein [Methylobacter sp.]
MRILYTPIMQVTACSILLSACVSQPSGFNKYVPGLGEIMGQISTRHTKLWYAGAAQNWELAAYEIKELKEGFEEAGKLHPTLEHIIQRLPVLFAGNVQKPLEHLEQAVKERNLAQFTQNYEVLTKACNTCHRATEFGFNKIKRPTFNPYSNQIFETEN